MAVSRKQLIDLHFGIAIGAEVALKRFSHNLSPIISIILSESQDRSRDGRFF